MRSGTFESVRYGRVSYVRPASKVELLVCRTQFNLERQLRVFSKIPVLCLRLICVLCRVALLFMLRFGMAYLC